MGRAFGPAVRALGFSGSNPEPRTLRTSRTFRTLEPENPRTFDPPPARTSGPLRVRVDQPGVIVEAHLAHSAGRPRAVRLWMRDAARRDLTWAVVIGVSFVLALLTSWQRWANPIVDIGREMNQPLRLLSGERLYSGRPPHLRAALATGSHAGLYRLFGPSLTVLYVDGIVGATIVLGLVAWLGRRIMAPRRRALRRCT